jgi:hypothetical protein
MIEGGAFAQAAADNERRDELVAIGLDMKNCAAVMPASPDSGPSESRQVSCAGAGRA